MQNLSDPLVSVEWLFERLQEENVVVLDASLQSSVNGKSIDPALSGMCIGSAGHFDINGRVCDFANPLPHSMPSPEHFEEEVRRLGVNRDSTVVLYDKFGLYSAPRAWWMFKVMGHENVVVLDGGLPAWRQAGYPLNKSPTNLPLQGDFVASFMPHRLCNAEDVLAALDNKCVRVLDARSASRFSGHLPEPRLGLRAGHMPNSINIPFESVLGDGKMLSKERLASLFNSVISTDADIALIASCGSGVTACLLLLAAYRIGYRELALYDGSWSEWGALTDYPVVTD